jgi:poly(3-hydroxybutyrate) depolymerase
MKPERSSPSFISACSLSAALSLALVTGACAPAGGDEGPGTGGKVGSGGSGTGGTAAGSGGVGSGGSAVGSGGQTGTGGAPGSGGATGSGGRASSGGSTQTGGAPATGGANGTGGTSGSTGGRGGGSASGGVSGTGGGAGRAGTGGAGGGSGVGMRSAGCGKTPTLTSGSRTIQSGGKSRSYILRIPDGYDKSHAYRLMIAYHWRGGTMQDIDGGGSSGAAWQYYGLKAQANNTVIFVAPQGIGNGWGNAGGEDTKLTDDMLALIEGDLCVDTRQIYALGFSFGGGMSYSLACNRPTVFRAVAVYSGGVLSGCEGGTQPVAYLGIHGLGDTTLDIDGGRKMRDKFVANNGCTAQSPPEPRAGSQMHTCTTYQGCKAGYPVEWCAFDGGHTPGVVDGGGDDGARTWTKAEVWKFFLQFQ